MSILLQVACLLPTPEKELGVSAKHGNMPKVLLADLQFPELESGCESG